MLVHAGCTTGIAVVRFEIAAVVRLKHFEAVGVRHPHGEAVCGGEFAPIDVPTMSSIGHNLSAHRIDDANGDDLLVFGPAKVIDSHSRQHHQAVQSRRRQAEPIWASVAWV